MNKIQMTFPLWIKYVFDNYALHMEFTNDNKLSHLNFLSA
jgi:hypothetical protein